MRLKVTTHSGDEDIIEVKDYDVDKITKKRNDDSIEAISIGNYSYSRIDIKNIKPLDI